VCLSVPPYQLLKQLVDFYEIQQRGHVIEGDIDTTIFNAVPVTILNGRHSTSEVNAKLALVGP
jgi:hypothetical protein